MTRIQLQRFCEGNRRPLGIALGERLRQAEMYVGVVGKEFQRFFKDFDGQRGIVLGQRQTPGGEVDVRCGGAPMLALGVPKSGGAVDTRFAGGTQIGKRYVNAAGDLELLCTKPGPGSLSVGDTPLALKEAKPLPSSD